MANNNASRPVFRAIAEMMLRSDLMLLSLDDDVVVFSEEAQCLFGLNASAAFIVEALQDGLAPKEIATVLVSEGAATAKEAAHWVEHTLEALSFYGLLSDGPKALVPAVDGAEDARLARLTADIPPYVPVGRDRERRYRLLDTCACIRFSSPAQFAWVDAAIGHLRVADNHPPTLTVELLSEEAGDDLVSYIYRDGEPVGKATALRRLGPIVKSVLWQGAVNAKAFFLNLHAGVIEKDGHCLLLPAPAGSGKSSLTAALVAKGFRYFSDEVALVEPERFHVSPVPLALCVKSTGWDVIARYFPEVLELRTHERMDGKLVRYLAAPARSSATDRTSTAVSHVVFPQYKAGASTALNAVNRIEAMRRLMEECLALRQKLDEENVKKLIAWISGLRCYELTYSSLDEATAHIARLWQSEGGGDVACKQGQGAQFSPV